MAIVNCTTDSFYAPSRAIKEAAVEKALQAVEDGADIIDFGAESTRPGAAYCSADEELTQLIPVIQSFRTHSAIPISVDTRKASVARAALEHGATIINDISALEDDPAMAEVCAHYHATVILMHKKGTPLTMQQSPHYQSVVEDIKEYLKTAADRAMHAGIKREHIIVDPGIGFAKTVEHNLELIRNIQSITALGYPLLIGLSRKSFIGALTGRAVEERLAGTLAATAVVLVPGVRIIRVHDVRESVDFINVWRALHP
ncbi:dihydropteroate synthase [Pillotina sp. SPG140]|jgi:dihydropteroate synthase